MHEMLIIVTDVCGVCLLVSHAGGVCSVHCAQGHSVQSLPDACSNTCSHGGCAFF